MSTRLVRDRRFTVLRLRRGVYEIRLKQGPVKGSLHWFMGNQRAALKRAAELAADRAAPQHA